MLSLKRYGWLCALGAEVTYVLCLIYGTFLSGAAAELHHSLFGLLPWFAWGSVVGILAGAIDLFALSWIFTAYMVWMHNSSLIRKEN